MNGDQLLDVAWETSWHLAQAPWWFGPALIAGGVFALGFLAGARL